MRAEIVNFDTMNFSELIARKRREVSAARQTGSGISAAPALFKWMR